MADSYGRGLHPPGVPARSGLDRHQRRRYYWFGEHKTAGEAGNLAQVGVHCYSSENLYDWRDEGIALSVAPEGSGSPIEKGCILERPKVIRNARTGNTGGTYLLHNGRNGF